MLRLVAVTTWLAAACAFKINQMGSDLRAVVVGFWVSKWFWWSKQARINKCMASAVLRMNKRGFGDVLGVVVFVPPILLLWPMFSVNFIVFFNCVNFWVLKILGAQSLARGIESRKNNVVSVAEFVVQ
ncbi:hypothetical protein CMV_018317 [Castanea mollissima]|uniref:Uncharacterized protein n=1 Tax=Castanea mollissima TaxID=60419 RepID=A0A8J4R4R9_9ROSI|nr:hypothetical protein CMV_018317 [Castanea mollissima]